MRYFAIMGIVMAVVSEFGRAMADGKVTQGEWIDIVFNSADKATETLIGFDLDAFRPVADEVKAQLQEGHASVVGLLTSIAASLSAKGIDYKFDIPGDAAR